MARFNRPRSELFLLAVADLVTQRTAYEGARERDDRFAALVRPSPSRTRRDRRPAGPAARRGQPAHRLARRRRRR